MARTRVVVSGALGTSAVERWSCTFNYESAGILTASGAQDAAVDIVSVIQSAWSGSYADLKTLLSNRGDIRQIDVYSYGSGGPAQSHGVALFTAPLFGSAALACPPQSAAVFSLLTDRPGASGRGRIYWPALGATMTADFKSVTAKAGADDLVLFGLDIQASLASLTPSTWSVYSPKMEILTPVRRVRAGDVIDTQRRRRDALVETYTYAQIPT